MTDLQQMKLERDQAVFALKMIIDARKTGDLFKFIDAIDAVRTILNRLEQSEHV